MIKRRNCYNDLAIENILDANVKLVDRNKELEKELKELKEKLDKIYNYITQENKELSVDCYYKFKDLEEFDIIKLIIEGREYEEVKDIFSII